ncbi:small subunit of serine palmitoyltransferase-like protein [Gigaspora margarita]|uniref:Small subunit of serine palmitoyltransferase-like protein n=1 Tax=Gigaspora margarita TaxID=4874 RepID=A0A8H4A576_GIGMA|nr:small subunit of serine palmitoyltransferase-like protein [Gigaspora margarita]
MFSRIREYLVLKNYQYEVTTSLYMLEPWEKALFNSLVIVGLGLLSYTTVFYLPEQLTYVATRFAEYISFY